MLILLCIYNAIKASQGPCPISKFWYVKIPSKVKVFLSLVSKGGILTKDVLLHKGWSGSSRCIFCNLDESIDHLLFTCPVARYIWNVVKCVFNIRGTPLSFDG